MRYTLIARGKTDSFEMHEQLNRLHTETKDTVCVYYLEGTNVLTLDDNSDGEPKTIGLTKEQQKHSYSDKKPNDNLIYRYLLVNLSKEMKPQDYLVCDTVYRISDDAKRTYWVYREFLRRRINFCFLDEPVINTSHFINLVDSFGEDQLVEIQNILTDVYKMRSQDLALEKQNVFKETAIEQYLPKYTNKNKAIAMPVIKKMHKSFGGYMTTGVLKQYLLDKFDVDIPSSTLRRYIAEAKRAKNK